MEFPVDCTCGARIMVREGLAGTRRTCECGRVLTVPSLHELRRGVGLPPYDVSPELVVEHLLLKGELPHDRSCACCGAETEQGVFVETECERLQVREGGVSWPFLVISGLLFGWWILLFNRKDRREYGKDKIYSLPLAVCRTCRPTLRGVREVKEALRHVPEYGRLLDKFPDAAVRLRDK